MTRIKKERDRQTEETRTRIKKERERERERERYIERERVSLRKIWKEKDFVFHLFSILQSKKT